MAIHLLGIYRLLKASIGDYRADICKRLNDQLRAINPAAIEMNEVVEDYRSWQSKREYNIMVAAIDMFFFRFPEHADANLRISTIGS